MRADRLLSILLLLQARRRMTAADLAERLEVSQRTIYRDLDALSAAGVPVYADRGPGGGCALRNGYRTDLSGLNAGEVESLFAGTVGRQLRDLGLGAGFQGALAKLEAGLPSERRADAERARQRIHVDPTPWFTPLESTRHLPLLRQAVLGERIVRLSYQRADGREVARRTQPLGLVTKGGIWYLAAMTAGAPRVYRVSRLGSVAVTAQRFERPRSFDLAGFWSRWSAELIESIPQYHFKLRVEREGVPILTQVLGERARTALASARRLRNGGVVLEHSMDNLDAATGTVLSLGTLVEVIEPEELRAAVAALAAAVVGRYARPTGPRFKVPGSKFRVGKRRATSRRLREQI